MSFGTWKSRFGNEIVIGCWLKFCQRWAKGLSDLLLVALGRGERDSGYGYARRLLQGKLRPSSVQRMLVEKIRCFAPGYSREVAVLQCVDQVALHRFSCQKPWRKTHHCQMAPLLSANGNKLFYVLDWTKNGRMGNGWITIPGAFALLG